MNTFSTGDARLLWSTVCGAGRSLRTCLAPARSPMNLHIYLCASCLVLIRPRACSELLLPLHGCTPSKPGDLNGRVKTNHPCNKQPSQKTTPTSRLTAPIVHAGLAGRELQLLLLGACRSQHTAHWQCKEPQHRNYYAPVVVNVLADTPEHIIYTHTSRLLRTCQCY